MVLVSKRVIKTDHIYAIHARKHRRRNDGDSGRQKQNQ
jgi:hypothetical protein